MGVKRVSVRARVILTYNRVRVERVSVGVKSVSVRARVRVTVVVMLRESCFCELE